MTSQALSAGPTRQRLIDVAIELFGVHSVAGTSLQMISDELGLTKSAIYHHFRTREELLNAVIAPMLAELTTIVDEAEARRGVRARADHMLDGYASLAASNRRLMAVLKGDPGVVDALQANPAWNRLIVRQFDLFACVEPGPGGKVKAAMVMAGVAAAAGPDLIDLDEDELRRHLLDAGRRILGLRSPRRFGDTGG